MAANDEALKKSLRKGLKKGLRRASEVLKKGLRRAPEGLKKVTFHSLANLLAKSMRKSTRTLIRNRSQQRSRGTQN